MLGNVLKEISPGGNPYIPAEINRKAGGTEIAPQADVPDEPLELPDDIVKVCDVARQQIDLFIIEAKKINNAIVGKFFNYEYAIIYGTEIVVRLTLARNWIGMELAAQKENGKV